MIDLVKVRLQPFLSLKSSDVASCEFVFCDAVGRDLILFHLTSNVLPARHTLKRKHKVLVLETVSKKPILMIVNNSEETS